MKRSLLVGLIAFSFQASFAMSVGVDVVDQFCSTPGSCNAYVSGGTPPYTYAWSNGATTAAISVTAGTYTVTVTDDAGQQASASGTVYYSDRTDQVLSGIVNSFPSEAYCPGEGRDYPYFRWGVYMSSIPGPYTFNGQPPLPENFDPEEPNVAWYDVAIFTTDGQIVPPGQVAQMQFMDGSGCTASFTVVAGYPVEWPVISVLDVQGACAGGALGSITVAYTAEGHNYRLWTEVRNSQDQIVYPLQWDVEHGVSATTQVFTGLAAGDYRLIQRTNANTSSMAYGWCTDKITVTVPQATNCGNVLGTVYMDYNQDCTMGTGETRVPNALLEFTPGPYYATTASNGSYGLQLPNGTYTVQQTGTAIAQHCPAPPATVTVNGNTQTRNFGDTALVPVDALVAMVNGAARPGFQLRYTVGMRNLTPATTGATSTVFTFDPAVSFVSADPAPSSVSGNVVTWDLSALGAFEERSMRVYLQVPPDIGLVGTVFNATATL
ncbi:MAG: SprB repeat-containing protein, partial [Flavobacteriales bacterium]